MEIKILQGKVKDLFQKYRYVILVFVIGLVLMMLPSFADADVNDAIETKQLEQPQQNIQQELEQILSQIDGAGEVRIMLTIAQGEQTIYQSDEDISVTDSSSTKKSDVVTVTDSARNQTGLIRQVNPPTYLGVIVLCQGADSPSVKLAILEAVSKVTGLGADKIAIVKMK